jgi:hypothetical protein
MPTTSGRDSSVRVALRAEIAPNWHNWRDREVLAQLGFSCGTHADVATTDACGLPRRAFVALEYEGPAWEALVARRTRERDEQLAAVQTGTPSANSLAQYLEHSIKYGTRLIVIDASLDAAALRRAHPDRRVIILPGVARAWLSRDFGNVPAATTLTGTIDPLTMTLIASPGDRDRVRAIPTNTYGYNGPPRYSVALNVGRHHEPWIEQVKVIDSSEPPH